MLLDSNILIAYLKGEPSIIETLSRWRREARVLVISSISVAEVLALPVLTPSDIQIVTRFLRTFLSIPFDDRLAETAARLARFHRLRLPDAAIAATAIDHGMPLVTRPQAVNGLGWSIGTAAEAIHGLREHFPLLTQTAETVDRWFELVARCQVAGKRAHDARLAALLLVHGVEQLLTFNTADFPSTWGVNAIHPQQLLTQ